MSGSFVKGVVLGSATAAAVVVASGVALAGTGVGAVFNLGQANTVNQASLLAGSSAHDQLDVANVNTGSSAKALGLLGKSATAPALNAANTGGGPALGLTVNSGKSPFTVNSPTKVANLNADRLDGLDQSSFLRTTGTAADSSKLGGLDASGYAQGKGLQTLANRYVVPEGPDRVPLLSIPGLGTFSTQCAPGAALVDWVNDTGGPIDYWSDHVAETAGDPDVQGAVLGAVYREPVESDSGGDQFGSTVALGTGGYDNGPSKSAIVHIFALKSITGAPCGVQIQATVWTGP